MNCVMLSSLWKGKNFLIHDTTTWSDLPKSKLTDTPFKKQDASVLATKESDVTSEQSG